MSAQEHPFKALFHAYIYDYLVKNNMAAAANAFAQETEVKSFRSPMPNEPPSVGGIPIESSVINAKMFSGDNIPSISVPVDAPHGFLFEWWVLFWDLYAARYRTPQSSQTSREYLSRVARLRQDMRVSNPQNPSMNRAAFVDPNDAPQWNPAAAAAAAAATAAASNIDNSLNTRSHVVGPAADFDKRNLRAGASNVALQHMQSMANQTSPTMGYNAQGLPAGQRIGAHNIPPKRNPQQYPNALANGAEQSHAASIAALEPSDSSPRSNEMPPQELMQNNPKRPRLSPDNNESMYFDSNMSLDPHSPFPGSLPAGIQNNAHLHVAMRNNNIPADQYGRVMQQMNGPQRNSSRSLGPRGNIPNAVSGSPGAGQISLGPDGRPLWGDISSSGSQMNPAVMNSNSHNKQFAGENGSRQDGPQFTAPLYEYQSQLMTLENESKRRLIAVRQEQQSAFNMNIPPGTGLADSIGPIDQGTSLDVNSGNYAPGALPAGGVYPSGRSANGGEYSLMVNEGGVSAGINGAGSGQEGSPWQSQGQNQSIGGDSDAGKGFINGTVVNGAPQMLPPGARQIGSPSIGSGANGSKQGPKATARRNSKDVGTGPAKRRGKRDSTATPATPSGNDAGQSPIAKTPQSMNGIRNMSKNQPGPGSLDQGNRAEASNNTGTPGGMGSVGVPEAVQPTFPVANEADKGADNMSIGEPSTEGVQGDHKSEDVNRDQHDDDAVEMQGFIFGSESSNLLQDLHGNENDDMFYLSGYINSGDDNAAIGYDSMTQNYS
ncbi:hypothetical protein CANCADRAFT_57051 [Tortispora caseinolytica NRRL Y-17796]|uniref:Uncharacterized protein n=1 Tax=Tortispora caseinolytica NRRL Y-17796 TaxID=767744 RepID=A0A1E4TFL3_9ASCO|nr:hypothetical protein CANCADRAFT_57051 [Tortispora caseinolytica NRRL Y-17796]